MNATREDAQWRMYIAEWLKGGVIDSPEVARRFGELVLENFWGEEELALQRPLTVEDQGDTWFVQGSRNRDRSQEGTGAFHATIKKRDAQVLDLGIPRIMKLSPEEEAALKTSLRSTGYLPPEK
jgi:hypothetical protein